MSMNINVQQIQTGFNESLEGLFSELGFTYRKRPFEYFKKGRDLTHIMRINLTKKADFCIVSPEVYISIPKVNRTLANTTNLGITGKSATFGFAIEHKHKGRGRYFLETDSLTDCTNFLINDFKDIALPFFEAHQTLEEVDEWVSTIGCLTVSQAARYLILAKLLHSDSYARVVAEYSPKFSTQKPILVEPFFQVLNYLEGQVP